MVVAPLCCGNAFLQEEQSSGLELTGRCMELNTEQLQAVKGWRPKLCFHWLLTPAKRNTQLMATILSVGSFTRTTRSHCKASGKFQNKRHTQLSQCLTMKNVKQKVITGESLFESVFLHTTHSVCNCKSPWISWSPRTSCLECIRRQCACNTLPVGRGPLLSFWGKYVHYFILSGGKRG